MPARLVPYRREHTGTAGGDRAQLPAQQAAQSFNAIPFASGVWVKGAVIGTTDTVVNHGLGRTPQGYLVTRIQGNAAAFKESAAANQPTDKTRQYAFIASGSSVTLDIWFF